jgi:uncharacterized protein with PQ loop repeat
LLVQILGWTSSAILLATIGKQVHKQWTDRSSKGVSRWLFIGQLSASVGFTAYSLLVSNWIFAVTNALMAMSAVFGLAIVLHHRRTSDSGAG